MGNTNSGWHLQVSNLQLAGTEERIFFFPRKLNINPKRACGHLKSVLANNTSVLKNVSLGTPAFMALKSLLAYSSALTF